MKFSEALEEYLEVYLACKNIRISKNSAEMFVYSEEEMLMAEQRMKRLAVLMDKLAPVPIKLPIKAQVTVVSK